MRIRRKPRARANLAKSEMYIAHPAEYRGHWQDAFGKKRPMSVELGCGKGGFISQKAFQNQDKNFLAIDVKSEMLAIAKNNIESVYKEPAENVRLTAYNIELISEILSPEDVTEEIYINFCNPWPKPKHRKRRLTRPKQLNSYKTFLKKGGKIYFKTDDEGLFADSVKYFESSGFFIESISKDIHAKPIWDNIITEHEKMFTEKGINIKGLVAVSDGNVDIEMLNYPGERRRLSLKNRNGHT
jgi:tRNA (guanine-N7-)-methyltransferase